MKNDMYTCGACGITHKQVECKGMWYCPNALCKGAGGAWFKQTLDSYKEINANGQHTIDENEWHVKGKLANKIRGIKIDQKHDQE
jgi:ribosomal protein L37AE/L43A